MPSQHVLRSLLARMLAFEPARRPTARQIEVAGRKWMTRAKGAMLCEWAENRVLASGSSEELEAFEELSGITLVESASGGSMLAVPSVDSMEGLLMEAKRQAVAAERERVRIAHTAILVRGLAVSGVLLNLGGLLWALYITA